ncbi:MAG: glutamate--tRNA ligase [Clostridia bacterium]|nr:glutamate--tRNA ligase [Clostridia bacterium]
MEKIRTRFAPSPTGYLHIGGMRTALYAYLFAKQKGGDFILRLEDTDRERLVGDAAQIIYDSMKESGLVYDEGPDVGGNYGPYIQSERREIYMEYANKLIESGDAYYCFCTKDQLDDMHKRGATKYDKTCLKLPLAEAKARVASGEPYVIRQNIPTEGEYTFHDHVFGDVTVPYADLEDNVLIKSDGLPTYNFANVVDDHLMGITHVIRGVEYLSSTPKYDLLYRALGWQPPEYIHLQPIMRDAQHKLSKRYGAASYKDFINKGYLKDAIVNYIALLGWSPKDNTEKFGMDYMLENFSLDGLSRSPSIFDEAKLRWLNGVYIKDMTEEEFYEHALPFMEQVKYLKGYDLKYLASLLHSRCESFADVGDSKYFKDMRTDVDLSVNLTEFLTKFDSLTPELFVHAKNKTDEAKAKEMLPDLIKLTEEHYGDGLYPALEAYATEKGVKKGAVLWIYRIAITASPVTPGGATEMATLLGKDETLRRLNVALQMLG